MSERDIPSLLQDILEAIGNIKDFTRGITFDMYLGDLKTKHAVERNFSIIGAAVARIDKPFRDKYPSVDWREVQKANAPSPLSVAAEKSRGANRVVGVRYTGRGYIDFYAHFLKSCV